jgi:nitroreductase
MTGKERRVAAPAFGAAMASAHPSEEARTLLALRRSTSADLMTGPGPDAAALEAMLEIAARVPDHRKIVPFRFIIVEGDARARLGVVIAERFAATTPDADANRVATEGRRLLRAPVVVVVVARIDPAHKTPAWEQTLTVGAVCLNLLLAASAYGFGANWLTEWYGYDLGVMEALGLGETERIAGFVYLGTAKEPPKERQRPVMADIVARF